MRSILRYSTLSLSIFILFTACQKELSLENSLSSSPAKGSLQDPSGNCLPNSVHATWYNGVTPGDSNYVDINVNITQIGSYKISTDFQNGVIFSDSGAFNAPGNNTVHLKPKGSFIHPGNTLFTFSFNNTTCTFTVAVKDSTGTGLGGNTGGIGTGTLALNSWKFTSNGHVYSGPVISAMFVSQPPLINSLAISGTMQSGAADTAFTLAVQFPSANIATGTYSTATFGTTFFFQTYTGTNPIMIFSATALSTQVLNIAITNYNSTARTVEGTFTGNSLDAAGKLASISNGAFKANVQ